jgi:hypothetical protein
VRTRDILTNLETYGFSRDEVRAMVRKLPSILSCTAERTNALLANLETCGFSRDEIRAMVRKLPSILGCTAERTKSIVRTLQEQGIDPVTHAALLMLSPIVLRGRIRALLRRNVSVKARLLNTSHAQWYDRFGETKEEILRLGASETP